MTMSSCRIARRIFAGPLEALRGRGFRFDDKEGETTAKYRGWFRNTFVCINESPNPTGAAGQGSQILIGYEPIEVSKFGDTGFVEEDRVAFLNL